MAEENSETPSFLNHENSLKPSLEDDRPYACCLCPKSFKRQDKLKRHISQVHKDHEDSSKAYDLLLEFWGLGVEFSRWPDIKPKSWPNVEMA